MPIPIALPQEGVSVAGDPLGAFPLHRLAQVQGEHRGQAALLDCAEPHRPRRPGLLHRPEDLERRSSPRMRKSVADFGPARPFGLSACGSSPRDCRHDPVHQHSPRPVRGRVDLPHPSVQDALRLLASWAATSTDDIQQPAVIDDAEQAEASRRPTDQVNLDEPPRGTAPRPCSAQRAPHEPGTPGDSAGAVLRSGLHLRRHAAHRLTWPMSDAFTGVRAVATPTVAESMRTVTPQDHATYAPVYGDTLAADYRRQPVWPGAAIRG